MATLVLAVDRPDIAAWVERHLGGDPQVVGAAQLTDQVVPLLEEKAPQLLLLGEWLEGELELASLLAQVRSRFEGVRVVLLVGAMEDTGKESRRTAEVVLLAISYGIYDVVVSRGGQIDTACLARVLRRPQGWAEVRGLRCRVDAVRRGEMPPPPVALPRRDGVQAPSPAVPRRRRERPKPEAPPSAPGSLVAVFSPQGGAGKSTLCLNLAAAAARWGCSVRLVNLALRLPTLDVLLELTEVGGLYELLSGLAGGRVAVPDGEQAFPPELLYPVRSCPGVEAVPAGRKPAGTMGVPEVPGAKPVDQLAVVGALLRSLCRTASGKAGRLFTVADLGTDPEEPLVLGALREADRVLWVVDAQQAAALGPTALRWAELRRLAGVLPLHPERFAAVLNKDAAGTGLSAAKVEAALELPCLGVLPFDPAGHRAAVQRQRPYVALSEEAAPWLELAQRLGAGGRGETGRG